MLLWCAFLIWYKKTGVFTLTLRFHDEIRSCGVWSSRQRPLDGAMLSFWVHGHVLRCLALLCLQVFSLTGWLGRERALRCVWLTAPLSRDESPYSVKVREMHEGRPKANEWSTCAGMWLSLLLLSVISCAWCVNSTVTCGSFWRIRLLLHREGQSLLIRLDTFAKHILFSLAHKNKITLQIVLSTYSRFCFLMRKSWVVRPLVSSSFLVLGQQCPMFGLKRTSSCIPFAHSVKQSATANIRLLVCPFPVSSQFMMVVGVHLAGGPNTAVVACALGIGENAYFKDVNSPNLVNSSH